MNLKFRPTIDQLGTFTYNAVKVILDYLTSTPYSLTSIVHNNSMFKGKTQNYLHNEPRKLENTINTIQSMVIFIVQKEYH